MDKNLQDTIYLCEIISLQIKSYILYTSLSQFD